MMSYGGNIKTLSSMFVLFDVLEKLRMEGFVILCRSESICCYEHVYFGVW